MPTPSITGSPAIVTMDRGMPTQPAVPNAQITPMSTTARGSRRQRTWKNTRRITIMIATAMAPSDKIPPRR